MVALLSVSVCGLIYQNTNSSLPHDLVDDKMVTGPILHAQITLAAVSS